MTDGERLIYYFVGLATGVAMAVLMVTILLYRAS